MFIGVVGSAGAVMLFLLIVFVVQGLVDRPDGADRQRTAGDDAREDAAVLRRRDVLRRQRDLRMGRLESDPHDAPRDPVESVRVLPARDGDHG
jgi:hypothetical protein